MAETIHRHLLGKTTYRVTTAYDNTADVYAVWGPSHEAGTLEEAKRWAEHALAVTVKSVTLCDYHPEGSYWWARIEVGTYRADDFDDDRYGRIYDAVWEPDPDKYWHAYVTESKPSEWNEV